MTSIELHRDGAVLIQSDDGAFMRLVAGNIELGTPNRNDDVFTSEAIAGQFTRQTLQDAMRVIPEHPTNVREAADAARYAFASNAEYRRRVMQMIGWYFAYEDDEIHNFTMHLFWWEPRYLHADSGGFVVPRELVPALERLFNR